MWSARAFFRVSTPFVMAAAIAKLPASMRSGMTLWAGAVQSVNSLDADAFRAVPFNFCPHGDEAFGKVADFGLTGGV